MFRYGQTIKRKRGRLFAAATLTVLVAVCIGILAGCAANDRPTDQQSQVPAVASTAGEATTKEESEQTAQSGESMGTHITITANGTVMTATLADNSSAAALAELLADGPLTIDMADYANMEKVGPIGRSLPTNDEQITTGAGDIILYQSRMLVIYYAPNSWYFTRLGRIDDESMGSLHEALGNGDVQVTLALA